MPRHNVAYNTEQDTLFSHIQMLNGYRFCTNYRQINTINGCDFDFLTTKISMHENIDGKKNGGQMTKRKTRRKYNFK